MSECCANCRFFFELKKDAYNTIRLCRRVPPLTNQQMQSLVETAWVEERSVEVTNWTALGFPKAVPDNWCGEWRATKAEEQKP